MRSVITILAAILLATSACSAAGPAGPPSDEPPGDPPSGADVLVFQWYLRPGFAPPGAGFTLPRLSVYGDGRAIGPGTEPFAAVQHRLTPAGVRRLLAAAADAGLTRQTDFGQPPIADAPSTVVTVVAGGERHVSTVPALSESGGDGLTGDQRAARARLLALGRDIDNLPGWLGAEVVDGPGPYPYRELALFALEQEAAPGAPQRPWPLGDLAAAGEPRGLGRCVIVGGADLARLRTAATGAPVTTLWRSGTALFHVTFRPLLPDERDCGALPQA